MARTQNNLRFVYLIFAVSVFIYSFITLGTRPAAALLENYQISELTARLLTLSVALPFMAIWLAALIGYAAFKRYADKISNERDGRAFNTISNGLLGLALWLPLTAIVGSAGTRLYRAQPQLTEEVVRFTNYFNLIIISVSFLFIYLGSRQLVRLINNPPYSWRQWLFLLLMGITVLMYVYLVFADSARNAPAGNIRVATYYLPDWLIAITLLIPRCIMWVLALCAVRNIHVYAQQVKGSIYRRSLRRVAYGVAGVLLSFIALRLMQSLTSLMNESLAFVLAVLYGVLLLMGISYLYIARGARGLQKIEEV